MLNCIEIDGKKYYFETTYDEDLNKINEILEKVISNFEENNITFVQKVEKYEKNTSNEVINYISKHGNNNIFSYLSLLNNLKTIYYSTKGLSFGNYKDIYHNFKFIQKTKSLLREILQDSYKYLSQYEIDKNLSDLTAIYKSNQVFIFTNVNEDIIDLGEFQNVLKFSKKLDKEIYLYNEKNNSWYQWDYNLDFFKEIERPKINDKFTSFASENLNNDSEKEINYLFNNSFNNYIYYYDIYKEIPIYETSSNLDIVNFNNYSINNPFIIGENNEEANLMFLKWIISGDNFNNKNATANKRLQIINLIKTNKPENFKKSITNNELNYEDIIIHLSNIQNIAKFFEYNQQEKKSLNINSLETNVSETEKIKFRFYNSIGLISEKGKISENYSNQFTSIGLFANPFFYLQDYNYSVYFENDNLDTEWLLSEIIRALEFNSNVFLDNIFNSKKPNYISVYLHNKLIELGYSYNYTSNIDTIIWSKKGIIKEYYVVDTKKKTFEQQFTQVSASTQSEVNTVEQSNNPADFTNHSGGAPGVDIDGDVIGREFGVENHVHYYTGTKSDLNSPYGNKEVIANDITEGARKVAQAANKMWGNNVNGEIIPYSYSTMKDSRLIRNWSQVKYSEGIYAVAPLGLKGDAWREDVKSGKNNPRILLKDGVQGGTGYAVEMGIQNGNKVYVFNTVANSKYDIGWYQVINGKYVKLAEAPVLTKNYAIIGSRDNSEIGKQAIRDVYEKTFKQSENKKVEQFKVEITKFNYTRQEVKNNPNTAYVYTENTYSITNFPDRQGGGSAIIRPEPNAFAIVTKKKYDYDTKENVDYIDTPENFKEFTEVNTRLINELKNSGKSKIKFPQGFATDKAAMPTRFAEWLQKELLDNFGLITELNSTKTGLISKDVKEIKDVEQSNQTSISVGFQGYKRGFENVGKGSREGDGKDKAMRKVANAGFIGELSLDGTQGSSTLTSFIGSVSKEPSVNLDNKNPLQARIYDESSTIYSIYNVSDIPDKNYPVVLVRNNGNNYSPFGWTKGIVMLARNGKLSNLPLKNKTKQEILDAHKAGAQFVVGDMSGVDSQFIDYLQEIGAKFTIYHTGNESRIKIRETKDVEQSNELSDANIILTLEFQDFMKSQLELDPLLTQEEILEFYKKCKL